MTSTVPAATPALPTMLDRAAPWFGLSGVLASVLIFSSGAFAPNPPAHGGTDAALLAHFRTHHDGTMQGVYVWILGAMALLLFAATLVRLAERARRAAGREPGPLAGFTLASALAAVAMLLAAQAGAAATAAVGHHAVEAALPRALDEIGHMLAHLSVVPLGLFVCAAAWTLLDARVGVRWLAVVGLPVGLGMALSGSWVFLGGQTLHDVGGLGWLAVMLWLVAQGVTLVRAARRPLAAAALAALAACAPADGTPTAPAAPRRSATATAATAATAAPVAAPVGATMRVGRPDMTGFAHMSPNAWPHTGAGHAVDRMYPGTVVIAPGQTVAFETFPVHQLAVYAPGTRPDDVRLDADHLADVETPFGSFQDVLIDDPANRLALSPVAFAPMTWMPDASTFAERGRYLVICTVVFHFVQARMYGWVEVR